MGRKPRLILPNTYYHVFNRGVAKMPIVHDDSDRHIFFKFLAEAVRKHPCQVYAHCLMGNHYHLMIKTEKNNLDRIMWHLQSHFARRINLRYGRVGPVFQGRYQDRIIDSDAYALSVLRYIHLNPVEAGLVGHPGEYVWSSYSSYLNAAPAWPWLNSKYMLKFFDKLTSKALQGFKDFHLQKEIDPTIAWPI